MPRRSLLYVKVELAGGPRDGEQLRFPRRLTGSYPLTLPSTGARMNEFYIKDETRSTEDLWRYVHWVRRVAPKT